MTLDWFHGSVRGTCYKTVGLHEKDPGPDVLGRGEVSTKEQASDGNGAVQTSGGSYHGKCAVQTNQKQVGELSRLRGWWDGGDAPSIPSSERNNMCSCELIRRHVCRAARDSERHTFPASFLTRPLVVAEHPACHALCAAGAWLE